uniref:G_PROTEIN_RECEP_F1_2 domain-containing protein n=1 Tax=Macrostomum lignano TaxID=282301 RepID=A0A1I8J1Y5_9PLAT
NPSIQSEAEIALAGCQSYQQPVRQLALAHWRGPATGRADKGLFNCRLIREDSGPSLSLTSRLAHSRLVIRELLALANNFRHSINSSNQHEQHCRVSPRARLALRPAGQPDRTAAGLAVEKRLYEAIWNALPPVMIPCGLVCNVCAFLVLLQPRLRGLVVHLPLTVLSVVDCVVLLMGLLRHWLRKASYFTENFGNSLDPQTLCTACCP